MGECEVIIDRKHSFRLENGDSFGELALINSSPRTATVRCVAKSELWVLDRQTYQNTLKSLNRLNYEENNAFIDQVPIFDLLTKDQKEQLISTLATHSFQSGTFIIKKGDPGDLLYIVKEGKVQIERKRGSTLRSLGKGEYFGEQALLYDCRRTATVVADGDVVCLSLSRADLKDIFGDSFQILLYKNSARRAFDRSEVYLPLTQHHEELIERMKITAYQSYQTVISSQTPMSNGIWICLQGNLYQHGKVIAVTFGIIGDGFCQQPHGTSFDSHVTAVGEGETATAVGFISAFDILNICKGESWVKIANERQIVLTLQSIPLFKALTVAKLEIMAQTLQVKNYTMGETIVRAGDKG